jgi:hypothetical protein
MNRALIMFSLLATSSLIASASLDAIVSANYPADLHAFSVAHRIAESREQAYAVLSSQGVDYVLAAYSNGHTGALVLLERTSAGYVVDDTIIQHISGTAPMITTPDLDGDGVPEALVAFDTGRGASATWVFRVAGRRLVNITPRDEFQETELLLPSVVDFDGSGIMHLIEKHIYGSRKHPVVRNDHYVLTASGYAPAAPLDFYDVFYREKSAPTARTVKLDIPQAQLGQPFRLTILNGDSSGRDYRVASGTVRLNGVVVSPPSDFSENRVAWSVPVSLQTHNTLMVTVDGKPRSRIGIVVRHD